MKTTLTSGYTFTPGPRTLDFSGVGGFDIKRLLGVLNTTTGAILYAPGLAAYGYTALTGSTLTLAASTAGMSATDKLVVLYDDPSAGGRPPLTYTAVAGSPFTLTPTWQKVATTTAATRGLRLSPLATDAVFDTEWIAVPAGSVAPTDAYGEPIQAGEDFPAGLPIGDIYLKSASRQTAIVKTGA